MAQSTPDPTKGRSYLNPNYDKKIGDKQPFYHGNITLPGTDKKCGLSAFIHQSEKDGAINFGLQMVLSPEDQKLSAIQPEKFRDLGKPITLPARDGAEPVVIEPMKGVLFSNKNRDAEKNQAHFYGYINPGFGAPLHQLSYWEETDRGGNLRMRGSVQVFDPNRRKDMENGPPPPPPPPERTPQDADMDR